MKLIKDNKTKEEKINIGDIIIRSFDQYIYTTFLYII